MHRPALAVFWWLTLVRPGAAADAATLEDAQALLEQNSYRAADTAFASLAADEALALPERARAWRGVYWSRTGREDPSALDAAVEAVVADPAYPGNDWLLRSIADLVNERGTGERWTAQLQRLDAALADVPALMARMIFLHAIDADQRGDWDALAARTASRGVVDEILVCGPFENVAGSGMSRSYPPQTEIDVTAEYTGVRGRATRWIAPRCDPYGVFDLDEFTANEPNALVYALTHVRVEAAMDALLHVSGSGAFHVWVNGELRLAEDEERSSSYHLYELPVRLQPGWNRILVKAGAEVRPLALSLRLTEKDGRVLRPQVQAAPPAGLTFPAPANVTPAAGLETFPATNWRRHASRWPLGETLADRLIVVAALLDENFLDEAETLLESLENLYPGSELAARQRIRALRQRESAEADGLQRAWAAKAPEAMGARLAVLRELRDQGEDDKAHAAMQAIHDDFPENPMAEMLYGSHLIRLGRTVQGLEILEAVRARNPRSMAVQGMYQAVLSSLNRQADYRHAVAEDLAQRPDQPELARLMASIELESHDVDAAIAHLEQALQANGPPSILYEEMAVALQTENRIEEALAACENGLQWSPYSVALHQRAADLLLAADRREAAAEHLRAALAIDPASDSARELLRRLEGKKDLSELFERDDPKTLRDADLSWIEGDAQACFLIDQVELTIYPGGAQHYRRHYAILLRDESAVANYRTLQENEGSIEIARILKPTGKEVEAQIGWGEVTFPDLAPGDVIEVRVQTDSAPQPGLGDHFWHGNSFQYEIPCLRSRFSLLVPQGRSFEHRTHEGELDYSRRDADEWTLHQWSAAQVPALVMETASPPALDQVLWLDISSLSSWDMLVRWFLSESEGRLRATGPVRQLAADVAANAHTDRERVHAVSTYVRSNIEYEGGQFVDSPTVPRAAEEVLRTKFGDCKDQSGVIISVLRELGIDAHFALVNSREVTTLEYLPSPRFTHAIVHARTQEDEVYWIDPTDELLDFPNVPSVLEGMTALLIDPALDSPFVQIPVDDPSRRGMTSRVKATLSADGQLSIEGECTYWGEEAALLRVIAKYLPDYMEMGLKEVLGASHPGATISRLEYDLGETLEDEVVLTYALSAPAHLASAGSLKVLEVPWTMWLVPRELVATEARRSPLEVADWRGVYVEEITLQMPQGLHPSGLEPPVRLEEPFGTFALRREQTPDGALFCRKELGLRDLQVAADRYAQFREFLLSALRAEQEQVVLSGSAP